MLLSASAHGVETRDNKFHLPVCKQQRNVRISQDPSLKLKSLQKQDI